MSDSLRDRIAAVDEIHVQLTATIDGWQCRCGAKFVESTAALHEWRLHKADAVIAELNLTEQTRGPLTSYYDGRFHDDKTIVRYVTDWRTIR